MICTLLLYWNALMTLHQIFSLTHKRVTLRTILDFLIIEVQVLFSETSLCARILRPRVSSNFIYSSIEIAIIVLENILSK